MLFDGHLSVVLLLSCVATAQNLTIPNQWRKPSSSLSRDERVSLIAEATAPLSRIELLVGQPGLPEADDVNDVYALLALQDYYSGNQTWRSIAADGLQSYIDAHGFWGSSDNTRKYSSDAAYWGLVLFYSYRTYGEQSLLASAVDAWSTVYSNAFITPHAAASGSGAGRNVSLLPPSNCPGGTFAGGVFFEPYAQNDTLINSVSIGPFMALSAYLFNETNNGTYKDTAQLSLDFIINHLWNGTIVYDAITLSTCQPSVAPWTANQAWVIEGLSVWANLTRNDTLTTLLRTMVPSIATSPAWTYEPFGIIDDHTRDSTLTGPTQIVKGVVVRALAEARMRYPGTDLADYIQAYIYVQMNAILDQARAPNSSYYSRTWAGPPASGFEAGGSIAAVDVLNAALTLTPPANSPSSHTTQSNAGAIAGGVVGGVVAVVTVIVAALLYRRRRTHRKIGHTMNGHERDSPNNLMPFVTRTAQTPPASSKSERMGDIHMHRTVSESTSLPASTTATTRDQGFNAESPGISELPGLVHRLNDLLQGREGELPPRYDE